MKTWIGQGVETRRINQRVKGYLLDVIVREALTGRLPRRALVPLRGCLFTSIRQDKGYKLPPIGFLSFLILHEAYQRGEICAALTESEQAWDDAVSYVHRDWSEQ